jgi:hypothetical protein
MVAAGKPLKICFSGSFTVGKTPMDKNRKDAGFIQSTPFVKKENQK